MKYITSGQMAVSPPPTPRPRATPIPGQATTFRPPSKECTPSSPPPPSVKLPPRDRRPPFPSERRALAPAQTLPANDQSEELIARTQTPPIFEGFLPPSRAAVRGGGAGEGGEGRGGGGRGHSLVPCLSHLTIDPFRDGAPFQHRSYA